MTLRNADTDTDTERADNHLTADPLEQRYELYRLCDCPTCRGEGKVPSDTTLKEWGPQSSMWQKCSECRGEGKIRQNVAGADTELGLAQAILTNGREGAWEGCAFGLLDREGEKGQKWLVLPWLPSARNVRDAGRTLAGARWQKGEDRDDSDGAASA